jgi:tricorn protease
VVPFFRFFDPQGNWSVENEGVAPDIEVTLDPIATNRGNDSQLDAAIKEIMAQLEAHENKVMKTAPPLPTELGQ